MPRHGSGRAAAHGATSTHEVKGESAARGAYGDAHHAHGPCRRQPDVCPDMRRALADCSARRRRPSRHDLLRAAGSATSAIDRAPSPRTAAPGPPRRVRGRAPGTADRRPLDGRRPGRRHRRRAQPHHRRRAPGSSARSAPAPSTSRSPATAAANADQASASTAAAPSPHADTTTHRGIPITTPIRTIIDLASTLPPLPLEQALDQADRRGLIDFAELKARPIPRSLQAILARYTGPTFTRSELEDRFYALCDNHDLPRPDQQHHHRRRRSRLRLAGQTDSDRRGRRLRLPPLPVALRERPRTRRDAHPRRLARPALHLDPSHDPPRLGRRGGRRTARRSTCAFRSPVVKVRRQQPGLGRSTIEA